VFIGGRDGTSFDDEGKIGVVFPATFDGFDVIYEFTV
jgi:hypothetical protein